MDTSSRYAVQGPVVDHGAVFALDDPDVRLASACWQHAPSPLA